MINLNKRRVEWPYSDPLPFNILEYIYDSKSLPRYPEPPPVNIMYHNPFSSIISNNTYTPEDILTESSKGVDENIIEYENSFAYAADK